MRDAIERVEARSLKPPRSSPDFHPIEQFFAKLKALMRPAAAHTIPGLRVAIREALTRSNDAKFETTSQPSATMRMTQLDRQRFKLRSSRRSALLDETLQLT